MDKNKATVLPKENILCYETEFIQIISEKLGCTAHPKSKELQDLIAQACKKFNYSPDDYLHKLAASTKNSPLLEHLIAEITIGETYFFRDQQQMHLLRYNLLPKIIKQKRDQQNLNLRIWSAGCASGEEIYTLVILLHELIPDIKRWNLSFLGTDINTQALHKAKMGVYNKWSMRSISTYYKQRYFTEKDNVYLLSDNIKECVDFLYLNLNDNTYPSLLNGTNSQDLILCRNVLIYFNAKSVKSLMKKISLSLHYEGFLLLGASDPVALEGTDLVFHHTNGLLFSHQDEKEKIKIEAPKTISRKPPIQFKPKSVLQSVAVETSAQKLESAPILCEKAKTCADIGQLGLAVTYCKESLILDPTYKDAYFILGLALIELNLLSEAETALRKTLFLDRKFIEGHFQLGLLLLKNQCTKEGIKCLQNALNIIKTFEPSQLVPNSQGLTYGHFAQILNAEIELYAVAGDSVNESKK